MKEKILFFRKNSSLVVLMAFLMLSLLSFFVISYFSEGRYLENKKMIQHHHMEDSLKYMLSTLENKKALISLINRDWAKREGIQSFLINKNSDFKRTYFHADVVANYHFKSMLFFNKATNLVYRRDVLKGIDYASTSSKNLGWLKEILKDVIFLKNEMTGLTKFKKDFVLFVATPVFASKDSESVVGVVVSMQSIKDVFKDSSLDKKLGYDVGVGNTSFEEHLNTPHFGNIFYAFDEDEIKIAFVNKSNEIIYSMSLFSHDEELFDISEFREYQIVNAVVFLILSLLLFSFVYQLLIKDIRRLSQRAKKLSANLYASMSEETFSDQSLDDLSQTIDEMRQKFMQNDELITKISETAPAGILIYNDKIRYINSYSAKFIGYDKEDVIGKKEVTEFLIQEDVEKAKKNVNRRLSGDDFSLVFDSKVVKRGGEIANILVSSTSINYQGSSAGLILFIDTTKHYKADVLYKTLYSINKELSLAEDTHYIYKNIAKEIVANGLFDFVWIGDVLKDKVEINTYAGQNDDYLESIFESDLSLTNYDNVIVQVINTGRIEYIDAGVMYKNSEGNKNFYKVSKAHGFLASAHIPIIVNSKVHAVISVYSSTSKQLGDNVVKFLTHLPADINRTMNSIEVSNRLKTLSYTDHLTGLQNTNAISDTIANTKSKGFTVIYINIQRFSHFNMVYGYNGGNSILKQIAKHLSSNKEIQAYRLYGDKFVLYIEKVLSNEEVVMLSDSISERLDKDVKIQGHSIPIHLYFGIATCKDGVNREKVLENANIALYNAKRETNPCFYSERFDELSKKFLSVESKIKYALENDNFVIFYQPISDIHYGQSNRCEALIRMYDKEGNLVPPNDFIPIAEELGLITEITKVVLQKVSFQVKKWKLLGYEVNVAINISAQDMKSDEFIDMLENNLSRYKIDTSNISIEITERSAMQNLDKASRFIDRLKQLGFEVEIDDFGTGYSSLDSLSKLDFDVLKIDKSFIDNLGLNDRYDNIVRFIANLAKELDCQIVAEGVEDMNQVKMLRKLQCEYAQGYYFSRPLPADEFTSKILDKQYPY